MFSYLTIAGGPRSADILRTLIGGPSAAATARHRASSRFLLVPGLRSDDCDPNVTYVADMYSRLMEERGIAPQSVCWFTATDLTVVTPGIAMMGSMTHAIRVCGLRGIDHQRDFHLIEIPNGAAGYRALLDLFQHYVQSHCK
jgi:hypothetical protein